MEKEIYEQPKAIADTIRGRIDRTGSGRSGRAGTRPRASAGGRQGLRDRLWHLVPRGDDGQVRHRALDQAPGRDRHRLRVQISRPGPRPPLPRHRDLANRARPSTPWPRFGMPGRRGPTLIGCHNVVDSALAREADAVLYTRAGPEIGVAATKTFTTQLVAMQLLGLYLAQVRGASKTRAHRATWSRSAVVCPSWSKRRCWPRSGISALARDFSNTRDCVLPGPVR